MQNSCMERKQKALILKDLTKKIVFLVGPRQVGKTWLAKNIAADVSNAVYLSYDHLEDRKIIKNEGWRESTQLLILDEIHKMTGWKNYLKGLYDTKPEYLQVIVTGSAGLDILRQVGDSLAGRFFLHHLLPFSPAELQDTDFASDIERFIARGGFPEPFLASDPVDADRWRIQYVDSLLRFDAFEINQIDNVRNLQLVLELLRSRVGSPVSYTSIAQDVGISPNTVKKYIRILEALYVVFRVTPFAKNIARSLAKEPKLYFFDTGLVNGDNGAQLENLVAICLLKHVYAKIDYAGQNYGLHYLKTKEGLEVDFALTKNGKIEQILEVKNRDSVPSKALLYFQKTYSLSAKQLVRELRQESVYKNIEIIRVDGFLRSLFL